MSMLLIANLFAFITACFTVAASWTKDPHRTYWYQVGQCLFYAIASFFFGVYASIAMMLVNAFRNALVAAQKYSRRWMVFCASVSLVLGFMINSVTIRETGTLFPEILFRAGSIPGYVSVFMTVYYTVSSFYLKSAEAVKLNVAIDLTIWFIYDVMICDVPDGIVDSTGAVLALVTLWRIRLEKRKKPA